MDSKKIILNMPFDESDGARVAYDYSQTRADGILRGAHFARGKMGNAISFFGNDTCEVSKSVFADLQSDFTITFCVQGREIECGSPQKFIWLLNFEGLKNYIEVPIEAKSGKWLSLAMTKKEDVYTFYVNSSLIKSIKHADVLQGFSLNQDYYGGAYGFGLLDEVKIYSVALRQEELIEEQANNKQQVSYLLDGVDFKQYGVYVSGSEGILNRPKLKALSSLSWDDYHGESVDLMHKFYEPREITLSCFVKAESKMDFIQKVTSFESQFQRKGTNRLTIDVHPIKPLIYEVYCKESIEIVKEWDDDLMVGTFKLKLTEPEPVKRVLKHLRLGEEMKRCIIKFSSDKYLNIYWGDGSVDYDICGRKREITHDYATDGDYFVVITGCIEEIEDFETNAIVVWEQI